MTQDILVRRLHDAIAALLRTYKIAEAAYAAGGPVSLNPADLDTLAFLGETKAAILRDVAARLGVGPTTATSIIDRLEQKGLVRRAASSRDRRQIEVALTDEGHRLHDKLLQQRLRNCRDMLDLLDPAERAELVRLMVKMAGAPRH